MPAKVLVTGANGFAGQHVCAMLAEQGVPVVPVARRHGEGNARCPEQYYCIDDLVNHDWSAALEGVSHVVHLAARVHVLQEKLSEPLERFRQVNVEATLNLAKQAMAAGVKRFVFVSSIGVHGVATENGKRFSENSPYNPQNDYALSKMEAEQALKDLASGTDMELVIVRPPIIYGAEVKANFLSLLKVAKRGIPMPLGAVQNQRDMLYIGNFSSAIWQCLGHSEAAGGEFVLCDGEPFSTPYLLRQLSHYMGRPSRVVPFPVAVLRLAGKLTGRSGMIDRLVGSLEIDASLIETQLGWTPPFSAEAGLQKTAEWFAHSAGEC